MCMYTKIKTNEQVQQGYKIQVNTQKSVVLLHTSHDHLKMKLRKLFHLE